MNVGIVTTWFERGAAYVSRQYRRALERQHTCFIYARGGEQYARGDRIWDDPSVFWATQGVMPVPTSIDLAEFRAWIQSRRLDLVWFNEQYWWEPVLLCHRLGVKTGGYMVFYREDEIPLYGAFDFLTCNSRQYYDLFQWHPQAYFLPWGTELDVFRPRNYGPVEPGAVTFFHSAGMNPHRKGTDQLVRAFGRVKGPARLVIHSQVALEPHLIREWALVEELRQAGRLTCRVETVPAPGLFHLGDVYVYPNRLDTLGLTVPEALACGLPVVIPDLAPMNEFVDDTCGRRVRIARYYARTDGHYWPQCLVDEDHLVEQMQYYADQREDIEELKRAARAHAERHLDWSLNSATIPTVFAGARARADGEKAEALEAARAYEANRARANPRAWLSYYHPWAVKANRNIYRWLTGRRTGGF
jgi:glycosyltransferase involved in cell wall biosynthesis